MVSASSIRFGRLSLAALTFAVLSVLTFLLLFRPESAPPEPGVDEVPDVTTEPMPFPVPEQAGQEARRIDVRPR